MANSETTGDARNAAVKAAFAKLPSAMRDLKREVISLVQNEKLTLLKLSSAEPLEISPARPAFQEFFTAMALTKGLLLPTEASEPWRWSSWWDPVLELGTTLGPDFIKGHVRLLAALEAAKAPVTERHRACSRGSHSA